MLYEHRELSPSPIIAIQYKQSPYFNWFVVEKAAKRSADPTKMEREVIVESQVALEPKLFPEGWLSLLDSNNTVLSPPAKKKKLSLIKRTTQSSTAHFGHPVSEVHYAEAAKGIVPDNTKIGIGHST